MLKNRKRDSRPRFPIDPFDRRTYFLSGVVELLLGDEVELVLLGFDDEFMLPEVEALPEVVLAPVVSVLELLVLGVVELLSVAVLCFVDLLQPARPKAMMARAAVVRCSFFVFMRISPKVAVFRAVGGPPSHRSIFAAGVETPGSVARLK